MLLTPEQDALSRVAVGVIRHTVSMRHRSLAEWGRVHGYTADYVYIALRRWSWRPQQQPHGGIARGLMADLLTDFPDLQRQLTVVLQQHAAANTEPCRKAA
jgi:hypothetical protein